MTPKLLILGGGFIGSHVVEEACRRGWSVTCASRVKPPETQVQGGFFWTELDVTNKDQIKVLSNEHYDYIVNLAGYVDHRGFFEGGMDALYSHFFGTINSIQTLSRSALKKYLYIGSSDEYGSMPAPQTEGVREQPTTCYSFAKTASVHFLEMLARAEQFPFSVLRLFLVYGPRQKPNRFLPFVISSCLRNESFKVSDCEQIRDFCYIDDVIDAVFAALEAPHASGQVYNVGSGRPIKLKNVVSKVVKRVGSGIPVFGACANRINENMALYPDISKIQSELGWQPSTDFEVGLEKTIEYIKQNG